MFKAFRPGSIVTPGELHRNAHRLDRRAASLNTALDAMRRGELLYLEYRAGRPHWSLTDGHTVDPKVAEISHPQRVDQAGQRRAV